MHLGHAWMPPSGAKNTFLSISLGARVVFPSFPIIWWHLEKTHFFRKFSIFLQFLECPTFLIFLIFPNFFKTAKKPAADDQTAAPRSRDTDFSQIRAMRGWTRNLRKVWSLQFQQNRWTQYFFISKTSLFFLILFFLYTASMCAPITAPPRRPA